MFSNSKIFPIYVSPQGMGLTAAHIQAPTVDQNAAGGNYSFYSGFQLNQSNNFQNSYQKAQDYSSSIQKLEPWTSRENCPW